jgi:hypothetical protein
VSLCSANYFDEISELTRSMVADHLRIPLISWGIALLSMQKVGGEKKADIKKNEENDSAKKKKGKWRRDWGSNPGGPFGPYTLSRRAP